MRAYLGAKFSSAAEIIEQGTDSVWRKVVNYECMVRSPILYGAALEDNFFFILNNALRTQDVPLLSPGTALADLYWYLLSALGEVSSGSVSMSHWRH
jgi:hypothetical protein